ncbi:ISL3 family transposase [Suicoccus acidiformans]|uniref:ISL3 family transposase n=1 Tax=Suicoccus acidiformans TaxID=2036206 RepID=A0A347WHT2_9LACT|nr:ISL3 family transposase [Suicoccus acidiformans]AXY24639.1 ISL3 family transposase [Suicoccus acidiformans]
MNHFIEKTFQLKDKNIEIDMNYCEEIEFKGRTSLFYRGTLAYKPEACPHCGIANNDYVIVSNGKRSSRLTLTAKSGLPAYLILAKQRFLCKACGRSFTAKTSIVNPDCYITNQVKQQIMDRATRVTCETDIAKDTFVSLNTVRRVIHETARAIRIRSTEQLPEHLSFDEFKSVKSVKAAMSFICCDTLSHKIVDVVEDRKTHSLSAYFSRFSRQARYQVQTITIDMYEPYMHLAKRWFPNAKIILDPFHLIQALNRELDRTRIRYMNEVRYKDSRLYNKLKRYWKLILKPKSDLMSTEYHRFPLFDWLTNTRSIVDYLIQHDDVLKDTYQMVHQLGDALRDRNWQRYQEILAQSRSMTLSKGLRRVLRTFRKYGEYIHNTLTHAGLSNGPIEGINNKIKLLKRNGYGYRNFSHFRDRILLMCRLYEPKNKEKDQATNLVA